MLPVFFVDMLILILLMCTGFLKSNKGKTWALHSLSFTLPFYRHWVLAYRTGGSRRQWQSKQLNHLSFSKCYQKITEWLPWVKEPSRTAATSHQWLENAFGWSHLHWEPTEETSGQHLRSLAGAVCKHGEHQLSWSVVGRGGASREQGLL